MIKELLMVLLLLQFSNGKWVVKNVTNGETQTFAGTEDYYGYTTDYTTEYVDTDQVNFQKCIDEGGELLGHLKKMCIQYEYKYDMQTQNNQEIREDNGGMDGKTELIIKILNLQVIQIDIHSITVSMKMEVEWWEYRLDMDTNELQIIYLNEDDQKQIWSPQIVIGNNMVSEKKNREEFGFYKAWNQIYPYKYIGQKSFYLSTTVICEMDFHDFPFDNHDCELEVS